MAARKKSSRTNAENLVRRAYRITGEQDARVKKLADQTQGQLSDNHIVRLALEKGLPLVESEILPLFTSKPKTSD